MRAFAKTGAVLLAGLVAGCEPQVKGSGILIEDPRAKAPFAGLHVEDGIHAFVTVGPEQTVKVVADSNIVGRIDTDVVDPDPPTSFSVRVLRVRTIGSVSPTIPPSVVVTVPSLLYVQAKEGAPVQLKRPAGSTEVGPSLTLILSSATLNAVLDPAYATSGAVVTLAGTSVAKLRSELPVTGSVSGPSQLDNLLGAGPCFVATTAGAVVSCR